jgi:hypothetical protein
MNQTASASISDQPQVGEGVRRGKVRGILHCASKQGTQQVRSVVILDRRATVG